MLPTLSSRPGLEQSDVRQHGCLVFQPNSSEKAEGIGCIMLHHGSPTMLVVLH